MSNCPLDSPVSDCENQAVIRRRVIVKGRVQGVFFRQGCQREAVAVGVAGWIHNNQDGTVEAALEGAPDAVERIVSWMRVGPLRAVVTEVKIIDETPLGEDTFMIR
jgi:acylphosphatase